MGRTRTLFYALTLALAGLVGCAGDNGSDPPEGPDAAATSEPFCEEHEIAEARCPYCNPELVETLGFCYGHGVPEAFCYKCTPALIPAFKAVGDWCGGHDRPESQCYICNPELHPDRQKEDRDLEIGESSSAAPGSGAMMELSPEESPRSARPPSVYCANEELVIRFESADVPRQVGLELARVERRSITQTVDCNARMAYDGNRHAQLSSQVPGRVTAVHRDLGDEVEAGDPLVSITSGELGAAKAAYLQALAGVDLWTRTHERETGLLERGVSTEREVLEVETALAESRISASQARQDLLRLGISPEQIDAVPKEHDTSPTYTLAAPFRGTVVGRTAAVGEVVGRDEPLFAVADISRMWALLDVYESDIPDVHPGQPVVLRLEALRGATFPARITWVASHLDPHTRTLEARAELANARGLLKANMFAGATVAVRDRHPALMVPVDAVQWEGCCNVVFVKQSDTVYLPRKVSLGVNTGTAYEVLDGLEEGEEVVTQGSFLLKTELLKGSIGAGCCEVNPGT